MAKEDHWTEWWVMVPPEGILAASALLEDLGLGGLAIHDPHMQPDRQTFSDYYTPGEAGLARVSVYAPSLYDTGMADQIKAIAHILLESYEPVLTGRADHQESVWLNAYKQFFHPFLVQDTFWVAPPWEVPQETSRRPMVILDPGGAFGTGLHPTTKMVLDWLPHLVQNEALVIDVGCGSGILSLASLQLGARFVYALDPDRAAIEATIQNARHNGTSALQVIRGYLGQVSLPAADLVLANLVAQLIIDQATDLQTLVAPSGHIVFSGILSSRVTEVQKVLKDQGITILQSETQAEWATILGQKREG